MSDGPHLRLRQERRQGGENRPRGLDLDDWDFVATQLYVVVRDICRVELTLERLADNRSGEQRLGDGYVLLELGAGRLHFVGDVFVVRSNRDVDGMRDGAGGELDRQTRCRNRDEPTRLVDRPGDADGCFEGFLPPDCSEVQAGSAGRCAE